MPADGLLGMALVLVQHLDPDHKSLLLDLVKRYTHIEVAWAEDGMEVRPGCAYVMPPNKDMALVGGRLRPRGARGAARPAPAHRLLLPLAGRRPARARRVHRALGHRQRRHPRPARDQGRGRHGHRPEPRDGRLRRHAAQRHRHRPGRLRAGAGRDARAAPRLREPRLRARRRSPAAPRRPSGPDPLLEVLHLLRDRSGHDFTHYKTNTLRRRVERRMAVTQGREHGGLPRPPAGATSLEVETLFRELLIGVTSFFRDAPAFETLATEALAPSGRRARARRPRARLGAGLLHRRGGLLDRHAPAGAGRTPPSATCPSRSSPPTSTPRPSSGRAPACTPTASAPTCRRSAWRASSSQDGDTYRVAKAVRDCLVFAKQDVTRDPPFSRVDLDQLPQPAHLHGRRPAADSSCRCSTTRSTGTATCSSAAPRPSATPPTSSRRSTRSGSCSSAATSVTPRAAAADLDDAAARERVAAAPRRPREQPVRRARARPGREDAAREARPGVRGHQRRRRRALHPRPHRPLPRAAGRRAQRQHPQDGPRGPAARAHLRRAQGPGAEGARCATSACACGPTAARPSST